MNPPKQRNHVRETRSESPEPTARPKQMAEELGAYARQDEGLSIDPEDMGRQFLGDAVEQGDFEARFGGDDEELSLVGAGRGDAALVGPNFEANQDVWENTINLSLQEGSSDEARDELSPAGVALEREAEADDTQTSDGIDLTELSAHDASLFDREGPELGAVISPELHTDDTHTHGKRRGGHLTRRR